MSQIDFEALWRLLPCRFPLRTQKLDLRDRSRQIWSSRVQSVDRQLAVGGPAERDGVERSIVCGESDILRSEILVVVALHRARGIVGWAFAEDQPGARAVDRFTVHAEPMAHREQDIFVLVGNRSIRFGTDIEEQVSVLADDVD